MESSTVTIVIHNNNNNNNNNYNNNNNNNHNNNIVNAVPHLRPCSSVGIWKAMPKSMMNASVCSSFTRAFSSDMSAWQIPLEWMYCNVDVMVRHKVGGQSRCNRHEKQGRELERYEVVGARGRKESRYERRGGGVC